MTIPEPVSPLDQGEEWQKSIILLARFVVHISRSLLEVLLGRDPVAVAGI